MKLTVRRKPYTVKGHYSHSRKGKRFFVPRHRVKKSTFKIRDRGASGRGKKIYPKLKKGGLGGSGFFKKSPSTQKRIVFKVARIKGERTAMGRLATLQGFFKRTKPTYSARAKKLRTLVAGSFRGRKRVLFPSGFSKRR